jgi:hypothetical protein
VLPDATLRSIADNLAALRLDPVLHLKIAVAVVAPLIRDETRPNGADPKGGPPVQGRRVGNRAARIRKRRASKPALRAPIQIYYDGQTFPSRGALAKHLAPILKRSVVTLAHALRTRRDDAEVVVRLYQQPAPPRTFSHDGRALMFLKDKLAGGPFPANIVDDEVEAGRLRVSSVEKAKVDLGLVARRVSNGKGAIVHLCTIDQAAGLEARP